MPQRRTRFCWLRDKINFLILMTIFSAARLSLFQAIAAEQATEDICLFETFNPRCPKNEVVYLISAIYGRMRIGRCITADEIAALQGPNVDDSGRYLGCSADVLPILDRKCSGKNECNVRLAEISAEEVKPCLPGLVVYLEVSYHCIRVADEERSCTVSISNDPIHITSFKGSPTLCGTKSQPWIAEAPIGQNIDIFLLNFGSASPIPVADDKQMNCIVKFGVIVEKSGKRNTSICAGSKQREALLSTTAGNTVHIFFDQTNEKQTRNFILRLEAIGCSDIIPPEDAWLKRSNDAILIGCYSSRQTWHLSCQKGKWVGVLGNCSQADLSEIEPIAKPETKPTTNPSDELVLGIVAIAGFTLAICIVVVSVGAICLRRMRRSGKKNQDYRTLSYQINTVRSHQELRIPQNMAHDFTTSTFLARNEAK